MKYYTYILYRIDKPARISLDDFSLLYEPYYVGKGSGFRINAHKRIKSTRHKKDATTQKLLNNYDYKDFSQIIKYFDNEQDAYNYEEYLINSIGLENLTNWNGGGNIAYETKSKGKTFLDLYGEVRACEISFKISESNKGKVPSESTLELKSISARKYWEDNRELHSEYLKGRKMPESFSKAQSMKFKDKPKSNEHKNKISAAMKGKTQNRIHKFNAAFSRAKNKYILNINNKKYLVIRQIFNDLMGQYNIKGYFYSWVKKNYIKIGNLRITIRKVERVRF